MILRQRPFASAPPQHFHLSFRRYILLFFLILSSFITSSHVTSSPASSQSLSSSLLSEDQNQVPGRILYDLDIGGLVTDSVLTYSTVTDPVGIVVGQYHGYKGLFISSFFTHSIYFLSLDHQGHTKVTMNPVKISGGTDSIDLDGSLSSASYAEPSRMAYDHTCNYLFVATRRTLKIRLLKLGQGVVSTLQGDDDVDISYGQPSQYSLFPGIDIQNIDNRYLFVAVGSKLYRISSSSSTQSGEAASFCDSIGTSAVNEEYGSLSKYLEANNYGDNARVYSVAPDENRGYLYVAICDQKNVILKVPIDTVLARDFTLVVRLLGVESASWFGDTSLQQPPISSNGYAQYSGNSAVKLSFPMHLQFDQHNQYLYWSECFPYAGDFLLGSLAIRRLSLITGHHPTSPFSLSLSTVLTLLYSLLLSTAGLVDVYAGEDFSKDMETYAYMGTQGGYVDGEVNVAQFKYPISFALSTEEDNLGIATGVLYVADRFNNAIRRVANIVDTPAPSISFAPTPVPTISFSPTEKPTRKPSSHRPTISMAPTFSLAPTPTPSMEPSFSVEPSFNPTKRPSKKPTPYPSHRPTLSPTKVQVIVEDVSLFHHLGLGTYHVTVGAMALSVVIGLFLAGMIIAGYIYRTRNPHRRLRTSDLDSSSSSFSPSDWEEDEYDEDPSNLSIRSRARRCCSRFRRRWMHVCNVLGTVIWGRMYSFAEDDADDSGIGGGMELSVNGSAHSNSSSSSPSMRRLMQTIRESSSSGSGHSRDSAYSSSLSSSPYSQSSSLPPSHPSLNHSSSSAIRISSLSHGSDGL
jgi:hypothetical protein